MRMTCRTIPILLPTFGCHLSPVCLIPFIFYRFELKKVLSKQSDSGGGKGMEIKMDNQFSKIEFVMLVISGKSFPIKEEIRTIVVCESMPLFMSFNPFDGAGLLRNLGNQY